MKKIHFDRLIICVLILLALLFLFSFRASAKNVILIVLESNWTPAIIWILAFTSVALDRFYFGSFSEKTDFMYTNFSAYTDAIFTIATFGFAGSTSVALLKGIYSQVFFDKSNFVGFGAFDLTSIFIISSFLLFYAIYGILKLIIKVVLQTEAAPVETA